MPIRPENKARYPKDWPQISLRIRERAGQKCEECGIPNYELGGRDENGDWYKADPLGCDGNMPLPGQFSRCTRNGVTKQLRIVKIILTVAHLDHQPENCADDNLRAWCQRCHNRYDMAMRRAGIRERQRAKAAAADLFCEGVQS